MSLKIVSDAHIPFAEEMFSKIGVLDLIPGHQIERFSIRNADALIVRSVTRIDAELLKGSSVQFVGSATAGTDHVDLEYLEQAGIRFANAPGGNADSVVEYVLSALFALSAQRGQSILGKTLGVVGCGQVGGRLARRARALGFNVLENDPPLERKAIAEERIHHYMDLSNVLDQSDIVSLHVPMTKKGRDRTLNLVGTAELDLIGPDNWLINAARGGVVCENDLLQRGSGHLPGMLILDVWENEPLPDIRVQRLVSIGTAHIAGYSRHAKWNTSGMVAQALFAHFGFPEAQLPTNAETGMVRTLTAPSADAARHPEQYLHQLLVQMYPIMQDHERTEALPVSPPEARAAAFRRLREDYPPRYAFDHYHLTSRGLSGEWRTLLQQGLGIQVSA